MTPGQGSSAFNIPVPVSDWLRAAWGASGSLPVWAKSQERSSHLTKKVTGVSWKQEHTAASERSHRYGRQNTGSIR